MWAIQRLRQGMWLDVNRGSEEHMRQSWRDLKVTQSMVEPKARAQLRLIEIVEEVP